MEDLKQSKQLYDLINKNLAALTDTISQTDVQLTEFVTMLYMQVITQAYATLTEDHIVLDKMYKAAKDIGVSAHKSKPLH